MNRVQKRFILDALDQEHKLSEAESAFINDLAEKDEYYASRGVELTLSEKQNEWLNRISQKLD